MSRIIIKGTTGLIDCGGSIADLGKEEYKKKYHEQSIKAFVKLGQYEDIDESPEHLAKIKKALEIIREKYVDIGWLIRSENCSKYNLGVCC